VFLPSVIFDRALKLQQNTQPKRVSKLQTSTGGIQAFLPRDIQISPIANILGLI
jgi:hypothetical protein